MEQDESRVDGFRTMERRNQQLGQSPFFDDRRRAATNRARLPAASAFSCLLAAATVALLTLAQHATAASQPARVFYRGKTLTLIVPAGAAGGYEYWAAALRPYLQKTLGVSQIDLVNKVGGGTLVGSNVLYEAKHDGLTIGEINGTGSIFAQIIKKPGAVFDLTKLGWIGSPDRETIVTAARMGSPYKTFNDLWKLRGTKQKVVALSAGYGGDNYVGTAAVLSAFAIPNEILMAYEGSSAAKAGLLRGDGDITTFGYSVFRPLIEAHRVVPLYIVSAKALAELPGVPTIVQLAQQYKLPQSQTAILNTLARVVNMGKDWAAPPGVPADRLAFLRAAFREAVDNPAFIEQAKKAGRIAAYTSPQELQHTIADVIANTAEFAPFLKEASAS